MARKAIICECVSNGVLLVDDCLSMGLDPVVVYPPIPGGEDTFAGSLRRSAESIIAGRAEVIRPESFDGLIARLDGMDVACVIAGSEFGIRYADMLNTALGLPGNDPDTVLDRTDKMHMHSALARAGIRHIGSRMVRSENDIRDFWHGRDAVIKPSSSVGTIGVHVCHSLEECIDAWHMDSDTAQWTGGRIENVMIQDYIGGGEFIVNTVSREGVHRVTDMWAYWKQNVGSGVAYDCAMSVAEPGDKERGIAAYALQVLDAVGVRNGPAHIEIKNDEEGPVLIEINARPMGGHFSVGSLEAVTGHHITDVALRSAVDPGFILTLPEGIPPMGHMVLKVLIVHEGRMVDTAPMRALLSGLESFRTLHCDIPPGVPTFVPRTEDLVSSPGSVELMHRDGSDVMDDFALLSMIEKSAPDLLYGFPEEHCPDGDVAPPGAHPGCSVISDDGLTVCEGSGRLAVDVGSMQLDRFYTLLMKAVEDLPGGGTVTIEPRSCGVVPYGRRGMNILLMLAGLEFDVSDDGSPMECYKP